MSCDLKNSYSGNKFNAYSVYSFPWTKASPQYEGLSYFHYKDETVAIVFMMGIPILVRRHLYIEMGRHKVITRNNSCALIQTTFCQYKNENENATQEANVKKATWSFNEGKVYLVFFEAF